MATRSAPEADDDAPAKGNAFVKAIAGIALPLTAAAVGAVGGVVASVVTPYADSLKQTLFHESAIIHIDAPAGDTRVADLFDVNIFVAPGSPLPLSPGELRISYSDKIVHPTEETRKFLLSQTPEIKYSRKIFESPLQFIADAPGDATIAITLTTGDPRSRDKPFSASLTKRIDNAIDTSRPRWDNIHNAWIFNGKWNINIGGGSGIMTLTDVGQVLSGSYKLDNGFAGPIAGQHDGDTFHVTLYVGQDPQRYYLYGNFPPGRTSSLNLSGTAEFQVPSANKGQFEAKQTLKFDAIPLL